MTKDQASNDFKAGIVARRPLFQFLFETALVNIEFAQNRTEADEAKTVAQWLSQDCSNALVLIIDYAIVRYLVNASEIRAGAGRAELHELLKHRGLELSQGVTLARAIATLADLARHLHVFQSDFESPRLYNQEVLRVLGLDSKHDQVAAQFLQNLKRHNSALASYDTFERGLLEIAE